MNTISNILQLWRFYWRTEKKTYLRIFLICFAIYIVKTTVFDFILMRISSEAYTYSHTALFYQMYSIGTLVLMSYLFDAVHHKQRAISYLSLPASNLEKFLSRFIMGVVGVPILLNVALFAGSIVVTLALGTMDSLAGNPTSWMRIFDYYSHHPDMAAAPPSVGQDGSMPSSSSSSCWHCSFSCWRSWAYWMTLHHAPYASSGAMEVPSSPSSSLTSPIAPSAMHR